MTALREDMLVLERERNQRIGIGGDVARSDGPAEFLGGLLTACLTRRIVPMSDMGHRIKEGHRMDDVLTRREVARRLARTVDYVSGAIAALRIPYRRHGRAFVIQAKHFERLERLKREPANAK